MSDKNGFAIQTDYRRKLITEIKENMSWLRQTTLTEAVIKGNQARFLVADSGDATATTRGINGLIVARNDNLTTATATLTEWHDLVRKTRFNIFQSQGNQRALMQTTTRKVLNRHIDADIIAQYDTATTNLKDFWQSSKSIPSNALAILAKNDVPVREKNNMFAMCAPENTDYFMQISKDDGWKNFVWVPEHIFSDHKSVSKRCYFWHRHSIGSTIDLESLEVEIGYVNEPGEIDYSYAQTSMPIGAKLLQQSGIVYLER